MFSSREALDLDLGLYFTQFRDKLIISHFIALYFKSITTYLNFCYTIFQPSYIKEQTCGK